MPDGRLRRAADYQETPCLMDGAKEGAFMTLTALPFKDYMNFAVGSCGESLDVMSESVDLVGWLSGRGLGRELAPSSLLSFIRL